MPRFQLHVGFNFYETEVSITRTEISEGEVLGQGHINFLGKIVPSQVLIHPKRGHHGAL